MNSVLHHHSRPKGTLCGAQVLGKLGVLGTELQKKCKDVCKMHLRTPILPGKCQTYITLIIQTEQNSLKMYSPGNNNLHHELSVFKKQLKVSCRGKKNLG